MEQTIAQLDDDYVNIIFGSRYEFQGEAGGVDGLVVGCYKHKKVVVMIFVAKTLTKARCEAKNAQQYWKRLASTPMVDLEDAEIADYVALEIEDYGEYEILVVLNGNLQSID